MCVCVCQRERDKEKCRERERKKMITTRKKIKSDRDILFDVKCPYQLKFVFNWSKTLKILFLLSIAKVITLSLNFTYGMSFQSKYFFNVEL